MMADKQKIWAMRARPSSSQHGRSWGHFAVEHVPEQACWWALERRSLAALPEKNIDEHSASRAQEGSFQASKDMAQPS